MTDPRTASAQRAFAAKLREIFQFDVADLDFGVYRILNLRRAELEDFLDKRLLPQVEAIVGGSANPARAAAELRLLQVEQQLRGLGVPDPRNSAGWQEAKAQLDALGAASDVAQLAREVFNDLTTFFSRYYDEGDFMPLPRYKKGAYAIPYDGSEVALHWANKDQYYIKTTELHTDYVAELNGNLALQRPRLVFRLHAAEADRDNNKTSEKRRYLLRAEAPVEVDGPTLTAWFEFKLPTGKVSAKDAPELAEEQILKSAVVNDEWRAVLKAPVGERTALGHQLARYMRKNTSDYFIHKDLGGFLRGELDHFIKAEVLHLDDLEDRDTASLDLALRKVKAIRAVGGKVIDWLHQVEEFQRKLYLKKKFVLRTEWLSTAPLVQTNVGIGGFTVREVMSSVDRVETDDGPHALAAFFAEGGLSPSKCSGLLVHGENSQAVRLLRRSIAAEPSAVYIDPPYNASKSRVLYKNDFRSSAWISMMQERLACALPLYTNGGALCVAIDENEADHLGLLLRSFNVGDVTSVSVQHNPRGIQGDGFSFTHESAYFVTPAGASLPKRQLAEDKSKPLMKTGSVSSRAEGYTMFYPLFVKDGRLERVGAPPSPEWHPLKAMERHGDGTVELWPIDSDGGERKWRYKGESLLAVRDALEFRVGRSGQLVPYLAKDEESYRTLWVDPVYNAAEYGSTLLKDMGLGGFAFPKSIHTVKDCVRIVCMGQAPCTVVDFFAGSGTTGQAILDLNRAEGGNFRFVLVEMGDHFDSVLLPRVVSSAVSATWRDGHALGDLPRSETFKVIRLESYDDTLDNIVLHADPALRDPTTGELRLKGAAAEDYHLRYQLDLESRGSLLNLDRFRKPWSYTIKTRKDGRLVDAPVDLVETFNYLLGLRVSRYETFDLEGILFVEGKDPDGKKVLVIWRDCDGWDDQRLGAELTRVYNGFRDAEFAQVYVNGDLRLQNKGLKVLDIESTFQALMFDTEGD